MCFVSLRATEGSVAIFLTRLKIVLRQAQDQDPERSRGTSSLFKNLTAMTPNDNVELLEDYGKYYEK